MTGGAAPELLRETVLEGLVGRRVTYAQLFKVTEVCTVTVGGCHPNPEVSY